MIKLSKTIIIILAAGVFAILLAGLGTAYSQQAQEQSELSRQLTLAQQGLEKSLPQQLSSHLSDMETRIAQVESRLAAAKASLRQPLDSIKITAALYEAAQTCNVAITEVNSSGVTTQKQENLNYSVLSFTIKLEGDVPSLISFVGELSRRFPTGLVKRLEIDIPEEAVAGVPAKEAGQAGNGEEPDAAEPSVNLQLSIYSYEGGEND